MLRDHFGASDKKMSRSELLQQKEDAFLEIKTRGNKNLTVALRFCPDGKERKCSENVVKLSNQTYSSVKLQEASERSFKLTQSISVDEVIDDNELEAEEFALPSIPNIFVVDTASNDIDAVKLPVCKFL